MENRFASHGSLLEELYSNLIQCCQNPVLNEPAFSALRELVAPSTDGIPTTTAYLSMFAPSIFPIIDRHVAKWANENISDSGGMFPDIADLNDFEPYFEFKNWCYTAAEFLSRSPMKNNVEWRPMDVEMAIFTAVNPKSKFSDRLETLPVKLAKSA